MELDFDLNMNYSSTSQTSFHEQLIHVNNNLNIQKKCYKVYWRTIHWFFDPKKSKWLHPISRNWSRMELDLELNMNYVSMDRPSFQERAIHLNTTLHIDKKWYRSKEVEMASSNIEKMVQDGTRLRPQHELCLDESNELPRARNTPKYYPPYR